MNNASNASNNYVDAVILGREYRVVCEPEAKADLNEAIALVDRRMREIAAQSQGLSVERIAVMAALNIANELLHTKSPDGFDIQAFRRRIVDMGARIDTAFSQKELKF